jgi:DivIVA domain-containing protein
VNEDLACEVSGVRLTPVRLREGYDMGQVDDFLDRLEVAVAGDGSVRPLVDSAVFTPVRFREGYDMTEVDLLIDRIANEVDRRASVGHPPPAGGSPEEVGRDEPSHLEDGRHQGAHPTSSGAQSVISEQQGFLSRLFRRK